MSLRKTFTGLDWKRFVGGGVVLAILLAAIGHVDAAEVTRVVSAGDPDDPFDFNFSVAWQHESRTAHLAREIESAADPGVIGSQKDLVFHQTRDVVNLRADISVMPDVGISIALPYVLADDRSLDFDRSSSVCATAGCVDQTNSTLLRDGILPGYGQAQFGLDAPHGRPFAAPSQTLFAGPRRHGAEYLGLGINWAVMNQDRDDTKPTWLIRFETRLDLWSDQRFDPDKPEANTAVGLGYHQLVGSTTFSHRYRYLDPYIGGFYMFPLATSGGPYKDRTLGTNAFSSPQHRAGAEAGMEATVWSDAGSSRRIALEVRGRFEARFLGLAQGPLWEVLSGRSSCATSPAACRAGVDLDMNGDGKPDPNPGVTRSPSYGLFGGDLGLVAHAGPHARFRGLFGFTWEGDHDLTDGQSGFPAYDLPGRRFQVNGATAWTLLLDGAALF